MSKLLCTVPRPNFDQERCFYINKTVDNLYKKIVQRNTINTLLGLTAKSTKCIKNDKLYYLSRSHLAAKADFFYSAQQNASSKYINVAPQWQSFNGFNWNQTENDSRDYASRHNITLQWTGTYGYASLPHAQTRKEIKLYLYTVDNARALPVPALYWKILYSSDKNKGIVLIGLNNP